MIKESAITWLTQLRTKCVGKDPEQARWHTCIPLQLRTAHAASSQSSPIHQQSSRWTSYPGSKPCCCLLFPFLLLPPPHSAAEERKGMSSDGSDSLGLHGAQGQSATATHPPLSLAAKFEFGMGQEGRERRKRNSKQEQASELKAGTPGS